MPCSSVEVCWISWATSSSCCRAWGRPSDDMETPPLRGVTRPCSCTCFSCTSCANWRFHVRKMRSRCCRLWLGQLTFTQVYINSADKNQDRERPVPKPPLQHETTLTHSGGQSSLVWLGTADVKSGSYLPISQEWRTACPRLVQQHLAIYPGSLSRLLWPTPTWKLFFKQIPTLTLLYSTSS